MTLWNASIWLLVALFSSTAHAQSEDDELRRVAVSCPAAAAWIRAHRASSLATKRDDDHALSAPALRDALSDRVKKDQQARDAWMAAGLRADSKEAEAVASVDAANTSWLKGVVARAGFPLPTQVGKQGVMDAWLLVQHADRDPAFQSSVLAQLEPRAKDGTIRPSDYAMLVDRVRINQGKPQLYGSQFTGDPSKPGDMHMEPVEDAAHLDERRSGMGLMPSGDYECALRATYAVEPARN
ncbi:DUF6624 domain-containing protein [Dyella sp. C11]|uniref:DUF6624 domain-containing protein n=1 Tax=Dyella sp. C11 TaxID=2126991 RepID=UPI000D6492CD|nr:DUF6624 domain-containing protein [Dyella sp. C11]